MFAVNLTSKLHALLGIVFKQSARNKQNGHNGMRHLLHTSNKLTDVKVNILFFFLHYLYIKCKLNI